MSDRPLLDKRDHPEGGFCTSPLRLNQGLGQLERWDVDAMRQRGEMLAARALEVWSSPRLSEEQRQAYRQASRRKEAGYSLGDHAQLANPQIRAIFDGLDTRIRALDPNVSQEVLKLYIAYKAETNFVDIVPQAKRLRLSLNMPFAELDDPKGQGLLEVLPRGLGRMHSSRSLNQDSQKIGFQIGSEPLRRVYRADF